VVDGEIEDTWYEYDDMRSHGAIRAYSSGSNKFPLKEGDLRVQMVIYKRMNDN